MVVIILAFIGVFFLIASAGMLLFYREGALQRLSSVLGHKKEKASITDTIQNAGSSIGVVVEKLEKVIPKSESEISVVQQRLIHAGFRSESAVKYFYGSKVVVMAILCIVITVTGVAANNPFVFYVGALGVGYLGPDFWLGRKIKARQKRIRLTLPDLLDLLIICVEAGLGVDQATARAAQELSNTHPVIADELDIVVLEQRAGRPRAEAWRHMAERTDEETVRNLVSMLVQSEQFGTSIAKTLRTHSETLRTQRVQMVEEQAAKTTVKLIFPLVLFIFPCLFIVTLGPAIILIMEEFGTAFH
jgi:tight adherence protein C